MTPTPPQPNTGDERLRGVARTQLIKAYYNGLDRKGWSQPEEDAALDAIMKAVKAELGAAIGEDEKTVTTRPVVPGSIDPSPTGTLDELSYTEKQRNRNQFRAELRNHFGIGEEK